MKPESTLYFPRTAQNAGKALMSLKCTTSGNALIFHLELTNRPDNRLLPEVVDLISLVLDEVERTWRADLVQELEGGPGSGAACLITSGPVDTHRFYSNGLDLQAIANMPTWFMDHFHPLMYRLLTFPIATIAAINGHCFAGGLALALAQDFRILKDAPGKGGAAMMCYNEVDFGAKVPQGMIALAQAKLNPAVVHKVCVQGHRFKSQEAMDAGLVDYIEASGDAVLERAFTLASSVARLSSQAAVAATKEGLYSHLLPFFQAPVSLQAQPKRDATANTRLADRSSKL